MRSLESLPPGPRPPFQSRVLALSRCTAAHNMLAMCSCALVDATCADLRMVSLHRAMRLRGVQLPHTDRGVPGDVVVHWPDHRRGQCPLRRPGSAHSSDFIPVRCGPVHRHLLAGRVGLECVLCAMHRGSHGCAQFGHVHCVGACVHDSYHQRLYPANDPCNVSEPKSGMCRR
jgi:hypothetical protein